MGRRRLEEGFILFAALEVNDEYSLALESIPYDKTELAKIVVEQCESVFYKKWTDHICDVPGCKSVVVIDGNMKNARQVCSCLDVGELHFDGMSGSILVGCQNTPGKKSRFCDVHKDAACALKDDWSSMTDSIEQKPTSGVLESDDTDVLPIKVLNERETRQGKFYEVLWSNLLKTWVKKANLPKKVLDVITTGGVYSHVTKDKREFGQRLSVLEECLTANNGDAGSHVLRSSGFAVADPADDQVVGEKGVRILNCGTEKGKHKCKNRRTAGLAPWCYLL
ncbi:Hypothetical predicted protein [Paramuricea clavata]|uniref:Uncharacterized protein n=1 Tax=Paramuricea clavata TaxID=317549 RepID=A0A6S7HJP8_PARCT|nr:Hypothetical predicted protein [Paramuricea clavata]